MSDNDIQRMEQIGAMLAEVLAGRYQVLQPLGREGLAMVFQLRDPAGGLRLLRVLDDRLGDDPAAKERFIAEAAALEAGGRVLEEGWAEGLPFVILEPDAGEAEAQAGDEAYDADPGTGVPYPAPAGGAPPYPSADAGGQPGGYPPMAGGYQTPAGGYPLPPKRPKRTCLVIVLLLVVVVGLGAVAVGALLAWKAGGVEGVKEKIAALIQKTTDQGTSDEETVQTDNESSETGTEAAPADAEVAETETNETEASSKTKTAPAAGCDCSTGPCCDGCRFRPAGHKCGENATTEYGCPWGTGCGDDVGVRHRDQFCAGHGAECDGDLKYDGWAVEADCAQYEACRDGYSYCSASPKCDAAAPKDSTKDATPEETPPDEPPTPPASPPTGDESTCPTYADAKTRNLTRPDLERCYCEELDLLRNEIYARHGRRFNRPDLQAYFDEQNWYHVDPQNPTGSTGLNGFETKNAAFIKKLEKEIGCAAALQEDAGPQNPPAAAGCPTYADAKSRDLTRAELGACDCRDLSLLRNEIYARHGRRFNRQDLQNHFERLSWYRVNSQDPTGNTGLNAFEQRNAALLQKSEAAMGCK